MRPLSEQRQELETRKQQLEARLQQIRAREAEEIRRRDTRRKVVVGALVLGAADTTEHHRAWLLSVLRSAPTRPQDREILEGLIRELAVEKREIGEGR